MEYLYTNLPRYVTVTPRTAFADSVVKSGSVLLFSEDGTTLTAKLPDGSFITVGGSGGTDVSSTTAEAGDVLSPKLFYNSGGTLTTGTIPTVSASVTSGAVVVPAGYIPTSQSFPVSGGGGEVYLCVSASDPTYYHINADTYGGDYYRDGEYNGQPVYSSGSYYYMPTSNHNYYNYSQWALYSSRSNDDQYKVMSGLLPPWECATVTSGGQMVMITQRRLNSGTWTGREMVVNSAGYYEPVASASATSGLAWTEIVPQGGQMYTADALKHIDEIWNYNYKRDVETLVNSSYQNAMRPDQEVSAEGITGPDSNGWFTFGDGASVTYSGYSEWDYSGTPFSAKAKCFTLSFKFKPVSLGGHPYNNRIISTNGITLSIDSVESNALWVGVNAALFNFNDYNNQPERVISNFTFTTGTEYNIVICCDGTYCDIMINNVRVVRLLYQVGAELYPDRNTEVSITLHEGWDWSWDGCEYQYKELSLWGRVLPELATCSSASAVPVMTSMGSSAVCPQGTTIGSAVINDGAVLAVAGTVMSAEVASQYYADRGLYVMSGGIVSTATVSSGGRMVVYSGGTALNVTSQTGADITVSSGGSISYVQ